MTRATVVGGGAIGLAVAWRLAGRGVACTVADPNPGSGASDVAAGMLAPVTEVHYGEEPLLGLNLESARRWPSFVDEVEAASELPVGYRREGTLTVAVHDDDRRALDALVRFQQQLDLPVEPQTGQSCRELEPSLTPRVRGGALVPADRQVDPRALVTALGLACERAGVELRPEPVTAIGAGPSVTFSGGERLASDVVVVAAGCRSAALLDLPVRPVKGQILQLRGDVASLLRRTVRGLTDGIAVYLVPRADGHLVVGATVEEQGFDETVTAGAVHALLSAATQLVPGVAELELAEARAGLRPGTPDNAPILGPLPDREGVVAATGHFRNGILLAPVTADVIADVVTTGSSARAAPFGPERFR
ncbi:MAG TPA: glycine oxidase ThiO [Acidimicrobiia bacterium]